MKRISLLLVSVIILTLAMVTTVGATKPSGPVAIVAQNDFSQLPFHGTFQVTEGADLLGCDAGTHVFEFRGPLNSATVVRQHFDCGDDGIVDFVIQFNPGQRTYSEPQTGSWQVWKGMGDFEGLRGQGDWRFDQVLETLSGAIHFDP